MILLGITHNTTAINFTSTPLLCYASAETRRAAIALGCWHGLQSDVGAYRYVKSPGLIPRMKYMLEYTDERKIILKNIFINDRYDHFSGIGKSI